MRRCRDALETLGPLVLAIDLQLGPVAAKSEASLSCASVQECLLRAAALEIVLDQPPTGGASTGAPASTAAPIAAAPIST
jgi:hypothetical protein